MNPENQPLPQSSASASVQSSAPAQSPAHALTKFTCPFGMALALSCVVNAVLVVAKEKSPALQSAMQKITGHHWVTHSAFIVALFLVAGWLLSRVKRAEGAKPAVGRLTGVIAASVILGGVIIAGFYLVAD